MRECQDSYISSYLNKALDILSDALRLYGPEYLFSSYNGGKDAVVIMHLLRAVTAKYSEEKGKIYRPKLIYFTSPEEFPQVNTFINDSEKKYCLDLKRYDNGISKGLAEQINQLGDKTSAFVLGTRKGDPNCGNQQAFSPSSSWMPAFMRVNPILDWEYGHVWHFLRLFSLPYCNLYDEGYTSLGKVGDTKPNPALRRKKAISSKLDKDNDFVITNSENEKQEYWPAYMLQDWTLERAGRLDKKKDDLECKLNTTTTTTIRADDKQKQKAVLAGLIIIGDEILNGFTSDVNLKVAATELESIGIRLGRVVIVNDDIDAIVEEVRKMSSKYDIVITSGGIGPTHDDVTIKAIAQALGVEISINADMMNHLELIQRDKASEGANVEMDEATKRLALLPDNAKLRFPPANGQKQWPILQCDNIFVLPGIPQYFSSKMKVICKNFLEKNQALEIRRIALDIEERFLVSKLNNLVSKHHKVKFGSYPYIDHPEYKCIITVEGISKDDVDVATEDLINVFINNKM